MALNEATRRRLTIDEFDYKYIDGKEIRSQPEVKVGIEGWFTPKLAKNYTPDEKVKFMDALRTLEQLQVIRRTMETEEEWQELVRDLVHKKEIPARTGRLILTSTKTKRSKAEWMEKTGQVFFGK